MTSDAMARDMIARASRCLREARSAQDESDVLLGSAPRLPAPWRADLPELARRMREITPKRGPAMNGLEAQGIPASEAFDDDDGRAALADADFVLARCAAWFEEWMSRGRAR